MINRSLIRIKTVQILYSYLLTRSDFELEPSTAAAGTAKTSRDNVFAYSVYSDLLLLLIKLSGIAPGGRNDSCASAPRQLKEGKTARALMEDSQVRALAASKRAELSIFDPILPILSKKLADSAVFADFKKKKDVEMSDEISLWKTVMSTIVEKDSAVENLFRSRSGFTTKGYEKGFRMLEQTLSSFEYSKSSFLNARRALQQSLDRSYDLYHALLYLPVLITSAQDLRLDSAKHKFLPSAEELNPNTRFIDNRLAARIGEDEALKDYFSANPAADPSKWRDIDVFVSNILDRVLASDVYAAYMSQDDCDYSADCRFWRDVMRQIILPSDELSELLESNSIYWNDDLMVTGTFVLKSIKRAAAEAPAEAPLQLLPKYMDDEDAEFGASLFRHVTENRELYRSYVDRFIDTRQWDTDRLAFMDIVIMLTAIAELLNYPLIPVAVTLNEYIEIANDYSTAKSGQFINGILYSVIRSLHEEGKLEKTFESTDRNSVAAQEKETK